MLFVFSGGSDTIKGFNETSTLQVGDGTETYSKATDNDGNIILTAGTGKVTLTGAASLSSPNILGEEVGGNSKLITLTEGNDSYSNTVDGATILALGGSDSITNSGANAFD